MFLADLLEFRRVQNQKTKQETRADESMQVLTKVILQGWPDDKP